MRIATINPHTCRGNVSVRTTYVVCCVCGVPPDAIFAFPMLRCTAPKDWIQRVAADSQQKTGWPAEGWVALGLAGLSWSLAAPPPLCYVTSMATVLSAILFRAGLS